MIRTQEEWRQPGTGAWLGGPEERLLFLTKALHTTKKKLKFKFQEKSLFTNLNKKKFEHWHIDSELPAKLFDYFLRSNKSNINQSTIVEKDRVVYLFEKSDAAPVTTVNFGAVCVRERGCVRVRDRLCACVRERVYVGGRERERETEKETMTDRQSDDSPLRVEFLLKTDSGIPGMRKLLDSPWQTLSIPSALTPGAHWSAPPVSALARSGGPRKMSQSPVSRNLNIKRRMDRPRAVVGVIRGVA